MRFFFYYFLFRILLGNPILALIIIVFLYLLVDRQFIGLFPDIFKPFRRKARINKLKQEVSINPANVNAYKELGELYLEAKKYKDSVNYLEKTLGKMGEYADIHFYLGKAYYLLGEKEKGAEELKTAIEINTKVGYGEPYIYLLDREINTSRDPEVIKELLFSIERFGTPEILYKAGKVLLNHDRPRAREMFREAIDDYKKGPKHYRKTHRRWAFLARLNLIK
ncbi:MAG: tetratricopeptide repeat protein [Clostridia bacterium]|nr:tetratricopeptide repeat protein [Clostridia bacterium]